MTGTYAELGNIYTRIRADHGVGDGPAIEESTPTTVYSPHDSPITGLRALIERAARGTGELPAPRLALVHLHGLPRAAVIGMAGLATTELTFQAFLQCGGSSVVQVRSSDAANLESQLLAVRAQPLDLVLFSNPTRQTAERLMAGGGPRPRVLSKLAAFYNDPSAGTVRRSPP